MVILKLIIILLKSRWKKKRKITARQKQAIKLLAGKAKYTICQLHLKANGVPPLFFSAWYFCWGITGHLVLPTAKLWHLEGVWHNTNSTVLPFFVLALIPYLTVICSGPCRACNYRVNTWSFLFHNWSPDFNICWVQEMQELVLWLFSAGHRLSSPGIFSSWRVRCWTYGRLLPRGMKPVAAGCFDVLQDTYTI